MRVVDTDDDLAAPRIADEAVDDFAYSPQRIRAEIASDVDECAQRDAARGSRSDDPMPPCASGGAGGDGFTRNAGLAHSDSAGQHNAARMLGAPPRGVGDNLKFLGPPDQRPPPDHRQILTTTGRA